MDRLIYTALSGMQASMDRQRAIASNMANTNTLGFRAELIEQRAMTIEGHPNEARSMQVARVTGADMTGGEVIETGRDLDLASRDLRVQRLVRPALDRAAEGNDELGPQPLGLGQQRLVVPGHDLCHAEAVPDVDENERAEVAHPMYPPQQGRLAPHVGGAQRATGVCSCKFRHSSFHLRNS